MPNQRLEAGDYKRGPGGRPTREEAERRHQVLLKTVFRLFSEKGWDGASIDEISRQSGVAKTFIYARYPDKTALLIGAIERLMAEALGTLQLSEPLADDIEEGLVAFGKKLLDMALQPEALAFRRQFFAEVNRFPELARAFLERNPLLDRMAEILTNYANRGDIVLSNARTTAEHFAVLVVGIPRAIATLVGREPPAQEDRRLRAAVQLFLNGCRARPSP